MVDKGNALRMYNFLKEKSKTNPSIEIGRLNRALGLVMSEDKEGKAKRYLTDFTTCFCPDHWQRGGTFICKHRLAFMIEHPMDTMIVAWEKGLK